MPLDLHFHGCRAHMPASVPHLATERRRILRRSSAHSIGRVFIYVWTPRFCRRSLFMSPVSLSLRLIHSTSLSSSALSCATNAKGISHMRCRFFFRRDTRAAFFGTRPDANKCLPAALNSFPPLLFSCAERADIVSRTFTSLMRSLPLSPVFDPLSARS